MNPGGAVQPVCAGSRHIHLRRQDASQALAHVLQGGEMAWCASTRHRVGGTGGSERMVCSGRAGNARTSAVCVCTAKKMEERGRRLGFDWLFGVTNEQQRMVHCAQPWVCWDPYAFDLCLGANAKSGGTGPSSISLQEPSMKG